ncbi:MAG TPA: glycoside hydrolase family 3 C-terminal domain-containing protein, partial [Gemmatimonadales bacterium]|nr:glycoside hydrolase family 3 C-terminal domain-containing protein [Gemmatimonadales bacterium]
TASGYADATAQALDAGLDVIFQGDLARAPLFQAAVDRGLVPDSVIDRAAARVLRLKFSLGLFDAPFADAARAERLLRDSTAHALARRAAVRSAVLLRNRGVLPLDPARLASVALIGVDAGEPRLGGYSGAGRRVVSARDALRARLGPARVRYAPGPGRGSPRFVTVPAVALRSLAGSPGLSAEYFAGPDLGGAAVVSRVDPVIDFHWTFVPPAEGLDPAWFSARWRGTITSPRSGTIRLGVAGTDGFRLFLGDSLVIDAWTEQGASERLVPVRCRAGTPVPVRLEFREPAGNGRVRLVWDVGVVDDGERRIAEAVQAARGAGVAVVMVGLEEGEFRDRASLALPGRQEELIRQVAATGTPTVVVVIGGGAVTMRSWLDRTEAVLDLWYPGEAGGEALADLLFGDAAPAGRLPITFPVSEGQLPLVYNHLPTGRGDDYDDLTGLPQFPFGFGLSYTRFAWSDLEVIPEPASRLVTVRCTIANTGTREGDEVVQLYLHHPVSELARPVLSLAAFRRVALAPGARVTLEFQVERAGDGALDIALGASSRDIRLRARVASR